MVGVCHISVNALFPREDSMGENEMEHSIYQNCCGWLVPVCDVRVFII